MSEVNGVTMWNTKLIASLMTCIRRRPGLGGQLEVIIEVGSFVATGWLRARILSKFLFENIGNEGTLVESSVVGPGDRDAQ